ncbi:MAG TPA: divergent polysaccharide deacetylase family protein [Thermodesulfobacteriota bacterium]|nr:divergent polysaccharide deacetylase family protein [Thermodesulfobacteriota bacterium]
MRRKQRAHRRTRINKGKFRKARAGRVVTFTLGFIAFVAISLYSLSYIKNQISGTIEEKRASSGLTKTIEDVDAYIAEALFNLGVSKKDVKLKRSSSGKAGGNFAEIYIDIPQGIGEKMVVEALRKHLSRPHIEPSFKKTGKSLLVAEIKIDDIPTHRITAVFKQQHQKKREVIAAKDKEASSTPKELAKIEKETLTVKKPEARTFQEEKPKVVIIVDDLGLHKGPIDKLGELNAPISFAILPDLPYSKYAAQVAHRKGWDVILHLPMEPKESSGYLAADAGDGALLVGLPKNEILTNLEKNLSSIPYIKGVNNHMGSKFTENSELMELVLESIKKKGLFFIDSRTSPHTTGFDMARKMGIKTAKRDLFLDNSAGSQNYIRSQIEKLVNVSKEKGVAIGICHPYPNTISVLSEMIPEIRKEADIVLSSAVVN